MLLCSLFVQRQRVKINAYKGAKIINLIGLFYILIKQLGLEHQIN